MAAHRIGQTYFCAIVSFPLSVWRVHGLKQLLFTSVLGHDTLRLPIRMMHLACNKCRLSLYMLKDPRNGKAADADGMVAEIF